jgi:hypothetical protein
MLESSVIEEREVYRNHLAEAFKIRETLFKEDLLLEEGLWNLAKRFINAKPYPHLVMDGLFDPEWLDLIVAEFADIRRHDWNTSENPLEHRSGSRPDVRLPPATQAYFDLVYSGPFMRYLTQITGVANILPDPELWGGGMHEVPKGGHFEVHVDFQKHPRNKLDNRFAMITYLNKNWPAKQGGALELWEPDMSRCAVSVLPEFGRTLLFRQSLRTPHGVVQPVSGPDGTVRRSVISYYYTNGVEGDDRGDSLTTAFVRRATSTFRDDAKWFLKRCVPPILLDAVREAVHHPVPWKQAR